jgi:nicotinamide mononucleotide transporter
LINVVLSFFLFYQVQLYPDMFLQVFFFVTNLLGWWRWKHPRKGEADRKHELRVSFLPPRGLILMIFIGISGTFIMGLFAKNLHHIFPVVFSKPSSFPYVDSFVTVMSIVATFYIIEKKMEAWIIWIVVDITATYLYFIRNIPFYSLLYFIFTMLACFALWNWIRKYKSYNT